MNNNYTNNPYNYYYRQNYSNNNDERFAGGFIFPFLLGGVTGAAIAPAFYNNRYNYGYPAYFVPQYPPYYVQPRRWF